MKRCALLDTDFISKTYSVQDDGGNHLIDRVMELPEYEFFCHAQIVTELNRYNADTPIWLSEKVGAQKIKSYTDQEILESLSLVRGPLACATYTQMLKLACDAFSKDYFSEHYRALEDADYATISNEDYLKELQLLDIEVGKKNNLGEIKSFVLLQVLSVKECTRQKLQKSSMRWKLEQSKITRGRVNRSRISCGMKNTAATF